MEKSTKIVGLKLHFLRSLLLNLFFAPVAVRRVLFPQKTSDMSMMAVFSSESLFASTFRGNVKGSFFLPWTTKLASGYDPKLHMEKSRV